MSKTNLKIICLITARKNSKRLKKKNIKVLGKKPLVVWSIDFSKKINWIQETWISSDDNKIKEMIKKEKNIFFHNRPKQLSKDNTNSIDVILNFVKWHEKKYQKHLDGLLLLQPTTPYRSIKTFNKGFQLFKRKKKNVIGFSPYNQKKTLFTVEQKKLIKKKIFSVNGSFYLLNLKNILKYRNIFKPDFLPLFEMNKARSIDIDTIADFIEAKKFLKEKE